MKRKEFDEYWDSSPFAICAIKYYIDPSPELVEYCHKVEVMLRKLSRISLHFLQTLSKPQLGSTLGGQFGATTFARLLAKQNLEWMMQDGVKNQSSGALIVHMVSQPYCAYYNRNKKIPNNPIQFRENCSIFWKDGGIRLLNDNTLTVKTFDTSIIEVSYTIMNHDNEKAQTMEILKECGGNLIRKTGSPWHFVLQCQKNFAWQYEPEIFLGIDVGKKKEDFIHMSNGRFWSCPDEVVQWQKNIKTINHTIKNSFGSADIRTKQRNRLHIKRKKAHKQHKKHLVQTSIIDDIIQEAIDNRALLCLDKLTSGTKNGTFGQDVLLPQLKKRCIAEGIPFVSVPTPYTSQRCNKCNYACDPNNKDKRFKCLNCGHEDHRDQNAAKNIAEFGLYIWTYGTSELKSLTRQLGKDQKEAEKNGQMKAGWLYL
jgi:predicted RNA-binding Zn-ribbon protein involved in translation (DUF1610 family)